MDVIPFERQPNILSKFLFKYHSNTYRCLYDCTLFSCLQNFLLFSKACAPGVHSAEFEVRDQDDYWEYSHLCDLCHGSAGHYCERNHGEDYFGHTGAFRCLVEGGGNVAFVKVLYWENIE